LNLRLSLLPFLMFLLPILPITNDASLICVHFHRNPSHLRRPSSRRRTRILRLHSVGRSRVRFEDLPHLLHGDGELVDGYEEEGQGSRGGHWKVSPSKLDPLFPSLRARKPTRPRSCFLFRSFVATTSISTWTRSSLQFELSLVWLRV